jgi:Phytanoyl-CoA dioxygenase (PhyH)
MSDATKIVKRKSGSASSMKSKNVTKVFANKLQQVVPATATTATTTALVDDESEHVKKSSSSVNSSRRTTTFESYLDSMAILGHDQTALLSTFGLFLLSLLVSLFMNTGNHQSSFKYSTMMLPSSWLFSSSFLQQSSSSSSTSTISVSLTAEQERLYQNLGPIPSNIGEPYVYHIQDLQDERNWTLLRHAYQRDGVVAIRGLIDDVSLLQRLDAASAQHVQDQWDQQLQKLAGRPRKQQSQNRGTQFFTNQNHLALTDPPFPSFQSSTTNNNNSNTSCRSRAADDINNDSETQHQTCLLAGAQDDDEDESSNSSENSRRRNSNKKISMTMNPFLETALLSRIPTMAAMLLGLSTDDDDDNHSNNGSGDNSSNDESHDVNGTNNLRLMRDIFLAKDDDPYICGWHVDDFGFWPVTADGIGINAWIALDDYDVHVDGGGFAVAVGSHTATWRHEAHYVTGASTTAPVEGYTSAKDLFERRTGAGTCNLKQSAPHLHRRMEETRRIYPQLFQGDVILHDRWLFHRTVPLNKNFIKLQQQQPQELLDDSAQTQTLPPPPPPILRRYSIRYGPGSSVIPPGYGTELSVLYDDANGGKTANQVCSSRRVDNVNDKDNITTTMNTTVVVYPWYPQAWPSVLFEHELSHLQSLVQHQFPIALQQQERHLKEMQPHRKRLARQHNRPTLAGNPK